MAKYRVVACGETEYGLEYHQFPIGTIVQHEGRGLYTNGELSQFLHEDEIEKVEE